MKVFVLGGTGFVGRRVVGRLHDSGHEVLIFHRGQTVTDLPPIVRTVLGDRQDLDAFTGAVRRFAPDVAVDIVPYTQRQAADVMRTFRGFAGRVVALSSGDVYRNYDGLRRVGFAPPDPCPLAEDAPLRENLFPYRKHVAGPGDPMFDYEKILVERAVLGDPQLPGTVLRLPMVSGPGDPRHRLSPFVKRMDDGRPSIILSHGQAAWRWARGFVENVAAAVALATTDARAAGRVYNVGEAENPTEAEWATKIGHACGWPGEIVSVAADLLPVGMEPDFDWRFQLDTDTSRLRGELGFREPVARAEALRQTIAWERAHPPADVPKGQFDYAAEDAALAAARAR